MFRLLLKYLIGLIILGLLTLGLLYFLYTKIMENAVENVIPKGVFYSIQTQLEKYPPAQWQSAVQKLKPADSMPVTIMQIPEVNIPPDKKQELIAGRFVVTMGSDTYYFGYGIRQLYYYHRIGNTQYVLRLEDVPMTVVAQHTSGWLFHLLILEFQQTPKNAWPEKSKSLSKTYEIPITTLALSDSTIPSTIKLAFKNGEDFVLGDPNPITGKIEYVYLNLKKANSILLLGPISYPLYVFYEHYILISAFIVLAVGFVIFLTFIFSRNLEKIYTITTQYSKGDFTDPPPISKYSTLRTLYENILSMGRRIQSLLQSQRNLTRFVAHECRTPVSTMLFAIDSLEQEPLSEKAKNQVISIKQDLTELNDLVSEFLNYARFSDQDLKVEYSQIDINLWLKNCLLKYQDAPREISVKSNVPENCKGEFDPALMKHVFNNLLTNAIKYGKKEIKVTLNKNKNYFEIHIEDDGNPIPEAEKAQIFSAFFRSHNTADTDIKGFGLGLYIAESIIQKHKGFITVSDSTLGGTRFSFTWPLHP